MSAAAVPGQIGAAEAASHRRQPARQPSRSNLQPLCPLSSNYAASMCGIFGYYNHRVPRTRREVLECLLTGLRRLEYRGYDSAGVCLDRHGAGGSGADAGKENSLPGGHPLLLARCCA